LYLVIFDCDGTLVDSQDTIVRGMTAAFEEVGLTPPDRPSALSIVGLSLEVAIRQLVGPSREHLVPQMAEAYRRTQIARRASGLDHDPLYPGAREVLDALHARPDVLLGIATGKALRGVRHLQEVHDLKYHFATIQTADAAPSKPHPAMILQAMAETGVEAARTVMIGDTSFDLDMARNAGVASIGVTWGYHDRAVLAGCAPAALIDGFTQLPGELARLFGWDKAGVTGEAAGPQLGETA
jgi:phosphoglycolate phosphatase|tara:strand:- start:116 stop:835 length:720 start_codon:yes stop_codon:yes gene_type:complete